MTTLRRSPAAFLLCVTSAAPALAQGPLGPAVRPFVAESAAVIVLRHARVVDGTGAPARSDQTVVIRDGRIAAVGPDRLVTAPAGARVIDLSGKSLIPGLIDLHAHTYFMSSAGLSQMAVSAPRLYLAGGITTVRTAGAQIPYAELNMKQDIDRGLAPGPRMLVTGPYLNGPGAGPGQQRRLTTEAEARRVVSYWADEGATWLKFSGGVSRAVLGAAIDEAHRRGMRVTGHLCSVTFTEAARLGIDNLEHGFITNSDFVPGKQPDLCPADNMRHQVEVDPEGPLADSVIATLLERGVALTSTLSVYELFVAGRATVPDLALEMLAPAARQAVVDDLASTNGGAGFVPDELFSRMLRFERRFVALGGLLAAGVDPWGNGSLPGFGDLRNYELLVEAGFTPETAVAIVTGNGAKVLGMADETGTITVGKRADLVVLDGDPTARASDIRRVALVFRDGIGYDPARLLESVKGKVGLQ
ncbi:MAG: amidohydrolase family protein [Gemmatimonadales bacterium]